MVRGRGGQNNQSRGGQNMGTRGGRVMKNNVGGGRPNGNSNLDFGFSTQTKNSYVGPKQNRNFNNSNSGGYNNSNTGGYNNSNPGGYNNQNPGGYNNQNPGGYNNQNPGGYNNQNTGGYNQNRNNQQQQQPNVGYNNNNNANNNNKRFAGNQPNNNRFSGNSQNNKPFSGNNNANNQQRGNNYNPTRNQGQNQNYGGSNANNQGNSNQGNNQNQVYRRQNQNQNNSGSQFNNNRNNPNFGQRNQNNSGFSDTPAPFIQDNFGGAKPSLLGNHPAIGAPPANNSDDIFKELGKALLTSMASGGPNPMANLMQANQPRGPLGGGPPAPSRYDNFYNNGNQYTNFNPPMFQNYRGGYNNARGGINNRGGFRNNARGNLNNTPIKRTPGTPNAGVKKQSFKAKNNPNFVNKGGKTAKTVLGKSLKFTLLQLNKAVDENSQPLAAFLKQTFYEVSSDNKTHFLHLSRILLKNVNVVKLFSYEVKKGLDRKFGEGSEEEVLKKKMDFLIEKKTKFINEYKLSFKDDANLAEKEKVIENALPILAGKEFNEEHVPKPEDYVMNPDLKEEDYTINFLMAFVKTAYEKFFYRLNFEAMPTKSIEKRFKFHIDNGFLSHLIVDKVKLKTNAKLPALLAKYCKPILPPLSKSKIETAIKNSIEAMEKKNELLQTNISDYIANEKVSAEVLRDFADCIILFDKVATAVKFKLVYYTPYINLSEEKKTSLFDELVKTIYNEVLSILKNNIKSSERKYEDMVKDEKEEEGKDLMEVEEGKDLTEVEEDEKEEEGKDLMEVEEGKDLTEVEEDEEVKDVEVKTEPK